MEDVLERMIMFEILDEEDYHKLRERGITNMNNSGTRRLSQFYFKNLGRMFINKYANSIISEEDAKERYLRKSDSELQSVRVTIGSRRIQGSFSIKPKNPKLQNKESSKIADSEFSENRDKVKLNLFERKKEKE